MDRDSIYQLLQTAKKKAWLMLQDSWPSIYTMINDFLWGAIGFFKDIFSSIFK